MLIIIKKFPLYVINKLEIFVIFCWTLGTFFSFAWNRNKNCYLYSLSAVSDDPMGERVNNWQQDKLIIVAKASIALFQRQWIISNAFNLPNCTHFQFLMGFFFLSLTKTHSFSCIFFLVNMFISGEKKATDSISQL